MADLRAAAAELLAALDADVIRPQDDMDFGAFMAWSTKLSDRRKAAIAALRDALSASEVQPPNTDAQSDTLGAESP